MEQSKPTAVVVGAGVAGMTSALILSMHGYNVTLIERAKKIGITLRGFLRKKVYFDSGLHFVGELSEEGLLHTYLRYLGMGDIPCVDFDKDCFESIRFADGSTFAMPIGYDAMVNAMVSAFPLEEQGIVDYMKQMRAAYDDSAFHTLQGPIGGGAEDNPLWQVSLKEFMEARIKDERLRTVLATPTLFYGVSPADTSFLQHARVLGTHFDSIRTFECGGYSLVTAYQKRMKEEGVTVIRGHGVSKITCSAERVLNGVDLDNGEHIDGSVVIYTGHPVELAGMLPDGALRNSAKKRMLELQDSISAHILYLTTKSCPPALNKRNVVVLRHDEPLERAFDKGRRPADGPFYIMPGPSVFAQDRVATDLKSSHSDTMDIVAIVPSYDCEYKRFADTIRGARPQAYKDLKQRRLAEFAEALFESCPDFSNLEIVDGATPLTLKDYLNTPKGGLYGVAHNLSQFNPAPVTRIPNLYIAGQAVTAPGIIGSLISAFLACGFVVGHEALLDEVRTCK